MKIIFAVFALALFGAVAHAEPSYNLNAEIAKGCDNAKYKDFSLVKRSIQEEATLLDLGKMVDKTATAAGKMGGEPSGAGGGGQRQMLCDSANGALDSFAKKGDVANPIFSKNEKALTDLNEGKSGDSCADALKNAQLIYKSRYYCLSNKVLKSCEAKNGRSVVPVQGCN